MGVRFGAIAGRVLDEENPVNWDHPSNKGLVSRWQAIGGTSFYGGPTMRDMCFTRNKPNNGTLTGGATWGGDAVNFTSTGQYVDCGTAGPWASTATSLTMVASCLSTTSSGSAAFDGIRNIVVSGSDTTGFLQSMIRWRATQFWFTVYDGTSYYDAKITLPLAAGMRYHFVGSYDGAAATVSLYGRDSDGGYATASVAGPASAAASPVSLKIGGSGEDANRQWLGSVFEARHLSRSCSESQAFQLWLESRRGSPETLNWLSTRSYFGTAAAATTRGMPFGTRSTAFNGGRTFAGNIR